MKILFYGHRGFIGKLILEKWELQNNSITLSDTRLNFDNVVKIHEEIRNHDRVFMCVGRTYGVDEDGKLINNIDYLETHLKENLNDNMMMPLLVATICKKYNKHLTYIGTGCIFSNNTNEKTPYIYTEDDKPDYFGSSYSIVKGCLENLFREYDNIAILRIRMPIVDINHPRNFITKILSYPKICNYNNSMTYLPDFISIFIDICVSGKTGIYNCVNKGFISHKEILDYWNNHPKNNNPHKYELITEDELNNMLASKRSNNILSTTKIEELYSIRHIKNCIYEAIDNMLSNYSN